MKHFSKLALAGLLVVGAASGTAAPVEILVKYKPGASVTLANALVGGTITADYGDLGWKKIRIRQGLTVARAQKLLASTRAIEKSEPIRVRPWTAITPNDPLYRQQYHHQNINDAAAWAYSVGSSDVTVAILDSGVRPTHEDLAPQLRSDSYDFGSGDGDPTDTIVGHGTHVAGCAAAATDNGKGVASPAWNARILMLKVGADGAGGASTDAVIAALKYAADKGARVANMSFGGPFSSDAENDAIQYAFNHNVVLVASAGNDGDQTVNYPANYDNVVSVAASDSSDARAGFSTYGENIKVAAPGVEIISSVIASDSAYAPESGTSMAGPVTAGCFALMAAYSPLSPNTELIEAMYDTADSVDYVQYGRINVGAAIASLVKPIEEDSNADAAAVFTGSGGVEGRVTNGTGDPSTDAGRLSEADGTSLDINALYQRGTGALASLDLTFPYSPPSGLLSTRIEMSMKAASRVTALVFVWNPTTQKFDQFDTFALSSETKTYSHRLTSSQLATYAADGEMRFLVRTINPTRLGGAGTSYRLSFDQARIVSLVRP